LSEADGTAGRRAPSSMTPSPDPESKQDMEHSR
jgi:hypothetical protein